MSRLEIRLNTLEAQTVEVHHVYLFVGWAGELTDHPTVLWPPETKDPKAPHDHQRKAPRHARRGRQD